jgi:hypothetical protein
MGNDLVLGMADLCWDLSRIRAVRGTGIWLKTRPEIWGLGGNRQNAPKIGTFLGSGRYYEGLKLPNSCPTVYEAQTPVTLRQEKDSPCAKNP